MFVDWTGEDEVFVDMTSDPRNELAFSSKEDLMLRVTGNFV